MKSRIFLILIAILFMTSCITAPPEKSNPNRPVSKQHDRSKAAFDELEDKPVASGSKPSSLSASSSRKYDTPPAEKTRRETAPPPSSTSSSDASPPDFSSSRYLTAKGYGQSKPESINNAKAELSNIFESKISSDVTTRVKQVTDSVKGDSFNKTFQSQINVASNIELEGVQVGIPQRDKGEYVTIAALDKLLAKEKWENDIQKIDSEIDILVKKSNNASGKILKLLPLKKTLELWVKREVTMSRLRVIGYASDAGNKDLKAILQKISDIKSSMAINIAVSGNSGKSVRDTVAKILTDNGFNVNETGGRADVDIAGSIKTEDVNNNNPRFKFSRAAVSLNILDSGSRNQVGQVAENERGAGISKEESVHNAIKKVSEKISESLLQYFN